MNTNITRNYFRTAAIAAVLTVSSASAQQPLIAPQAIIAPQGTVVYINGQAMMLTPVQATPVPQGYQPQSAVQTQQAIYAQPGVAMMPSYIAPQQGYQPQQPQLQPAQGSTPYSAFPQYVGQGAGVANGQLRRMSLPTGSPVYVRLISSISSNRLVPGAPFEASLDAPLEVNGLVIAERGARVEGRISESDAAGKISGQSRLAFQLTRIMTADGKALDIQTNTIATTGGTSYGTDVAKVAGLAGVGAALGAINSGRGAAIGSAAGAAAGVGWVLNSRGKATTIASETRLEFHLIAPVTFTTW